jgi:ribosomal protein S18 acetylase RimI-like enzyme
MIWEARGLLVCENPRVMELQIRPANPSDSEIVALLGRITFVETFGHLFVHHAADLSAYLDHTFAVAKIRNSLGESDNRYWLALRDGLPVAYAKLKYPSPTALLPGEDPAQLQKVYVLRELLDLGIGKVLLAAVLDDATRRGLGTIWLDVLKQNGRAIRFYERQGFLPLGDDTYTIGAQTFEFHLMALRRSAR